MGGGAGGRPVQVGRRVCRAFSKAKMKHTLTACFARTLTVTIFRKMVMNTGSQQKL